MDHTETHGTKSKTYLVQYIMQLHLLKVLHYWYTLIKVEAM